MKITRIEVGMSRTVNLKANDFAKVHVLYEAEVEAGDDHCEVYDGLKDMARRRVDNEIKDLLGH